MSLKGPYAEAVDTFFDRLKELYPAWVSPLRSRILALVASAAVLAILSPILIKHTRILRDATAPPRERGVSAGVLLGSAVGVVAFSGAVQETIFRLDMLKKNKLHFAFEYFIARYAEAMRPGVLLRAV